MTNGDRIRQMSDIELAKQICRLRDACDSFCPMSYDCDGGDCAASWLDWLEQEVDSEFPSV